MAMALRENPINWEDRISEKRHMLSSNIKRRRRRQRRRLQQPGVPIPIYEHDTGSCPDAGSRGVPCAPANLSLYCNKFDRIEGSFAECLASCAPSFCCVHDKTTNPFAVSCNDDENCAQYAPCYIAFWKLQDMVGPATEFQLYQTDDWFDVDILQDVIMDPLFYQQLLFHHFDDMDPILVLLGQSDSVQEVFASSEIWDADSAISGQPPPGTGIKENEQV